MTAFYSSVTCAEKFGTRVEPQDYNDSEPEVTLQCAWAARWALVSDLLLNRNPWPDLATLTNPPRPISCSITPFGAGIAVGQVQAYAMADVHVRYSSKIPQTTELVAESIESYAECLKQPHQWFAWNGPAPPGSSSRNLTTNPYPVKLDPEEAPSQQFYSLILKRTIFHVDPGAVPDSIFADIGGVNQAAYTSALLGGFVFQPETLLLMPTQIDRTVTMSFDLAFNLHLTFGFRPQGWNKFYRQRTQQWEYQYIVDEFGDIAIDSSGPIINRTYPLTDYADLLF